MGWKERGGDGRIGGLFERVGLTPFWDSQEADTMDSHRLAWHAAQQSPETGERLWAALSERYFEGKHTQIRPIRLDSHELLLECAEEAGLDREDSRRVLTSGAYEDEVHASFRQVQKMGVDSIPVVIFECQGLGDGLREPPHLACQQSNAYRANAAVLRRPRLHLPTSLCASLI